MLIYYSNCTFNNQVIQININQITGYFLISIIIKCLESILMIKILGKVICIILDYISSTTDATNYNLFKELISPIVNYNHQKISETKWAKIPILHIFFLMIIRCIISFMADYLFMHQIDNTTTKKMFNFLLYKIKPNYFEIDIFSQFFLNKIGFKAANGMKSLVRIFAIDIAHLLVFCQFVNDILIVLFCIYTITSIFLKLRIMKKNYKLLDESCKQLDGLLPNENDVNDFFSLLKNNYSLETLNKLTLFIAIGCLILGNHKEDSDILSYLMLFFYGTNTLQYDKHFDAISKLQIFSLLLNRIQTVKNHTTDIPIKEMKLVNLNKNIILPSLEYYGVKTQIFQNLNLNIHYGDKIVIYSNQKAGKTILLKTIANSDQDLEDHNIQINNQYDFAKLSNKRCLFLDTNNSIIDNTNHLIENIQKYSGEKSIQTIKYILKQNKINIDYLLMDQKNDLSKTNIKKILLSIGMLKALAGKIDILLIDNNLLEIYNYQDQKEIINNLLNLQCTVVIATNTPINFINKKCNIFHLFDKKLHKMN